MDDRARQSLLLRSGSAHFFFTRESSNEDSLSSLMTDETTSEMTDKMTELASSQMRVLGLQTVSFLLQIRESSIEDLLACLPSGDLGGKTALALLTREM